MKLLSCHIENYGKLSGADFRFDPALTAFCEENGYGKTTLASFLKAMFYGLDSDRANSGFNERRRFAPFAGGNFGGSVLFEAGGKQYKIERFFDEKSETKDSFTLYTDGVPTPLQGSAGEKFFGIDRQSFERTAFLSGADVEVSSTGGINAKLNNFVAGGEDGSNLDAAVLRLGNKGKEYKKSRMGNDLISRETARINGLSEEIKNAEVIADGLQEKYARLDGLEKEIAGLGARISAAQSENVVLNDWEHYDALLSEIASKREAAAVIERRYPRGIPEKAEISAAEEALGREKELMARADGKSFTEEDGARLAALSAEFSGGVPDGARLAVAEADIAAAAELSYVTERAEKDLTENESAIMRRFALREPSEGETAKVKELAARYKEAEAECSRIPDSSVNAPAKGVAKKGAYIAAAAVSLLVAAAGIAVVFFQLVAGIVLIVAGAAGLLGTGFLYLNKKAGSAQAGAGISPEKAAANARRDAAYAELASALTPYGYSFSDGAAYAAASFIGDAARYGELKSARESEKALQETKSGEKRALDEKLGEFFASYGLTAGSYVERLASLRSDADAYNDLSERKRKAEREERELNARVAENREPIALFCRKYGFEENGIAVGIKNIAKDRDGYDAAVKDIEERERKAAKFREEKGLYDRPANGKQDLGALNAALAAAQDKKNALFSEVTDDEREAEKLGDLRAARDGARQRLAEYRDDYDLITETISLLEQADKNLKDRYVRPVKDKFVYYSALIEKTLGEKVTMGADFSVRYERCGRERSEKHLSSGLRSICALCFRLALIENMYAGEKPFLIFDDPFTGLDEAHMEKVKELLKGLSQKFQLVYFSCHPSRAVTY